MSKTAILTKNAPKPIGTYSQAIKAGPLVFLSGIKVKDTHLIRIQPGRGHTGVCNPSLYVDVNQLNASPRRSRNRTT